LDKLRAIRYFLKVGETCSFKQTALHFGVPASTVSRSIKALEVELGAALVERTTRKVRLTETGAWYRSEVSAPLRALAAADALVDARSREAKGTLRMTALAGHGEILLFSVLERFRAAHPNIVCDLELSDRYLDLSTGDIDLAVRATADPPEYLVARRLHAHRFVLVAAPRYLAQRGRPRTLTDLEAHLAICYRGAGGVAPWLAVRPNGDVVSVPTTPVLITNYARLMLQAALAGDGLAFFPRWGAAKALADGTLEEIHLEDCRLVSRTGPERSIFLLYPPKKARLGKVRAMVDFLMEAIGE